MRSFRPTGGGSPINRTNRNQVSTAAGGTLPRWWSDGKELFYIALDQKLMAAEVGAKGETFESGQVSALFGGFLTGSGLLDDVAADGQSFLVVAPPEQSTTAEPLTVVQNWTAALKK
jgi:hypothetical protein